VNGNLNGLDFGWGTGASLGPEGVQAGIFAGTSDPSPPPFSSPLPPPAMYANGMYGNSMGMYGMYGSGMGGMGGMGGMARSRMMGINTMGGGYYGNWGDVAQSISPGYVTSPYIPLPNDIGKILPLLLNFIIIDVDGRCLMYIFLIFLTFLFLTTIFLFFHLLSSTAIL